MDNTMRIFNNVLLEGWRVDGHEGAIDWARGFVWQEESTEIWPPNHSALCIDELEDIGVGVYYDLSSDHYFFVDMLKG